MSFAIDEQVKTKIKLAEPTKYNLWALNNDLTSFDEVVMILVMALKINPSVAGELTLKIDKEGRAKLNPQPLSYNVAQALLTKLNDTKRLLASHSPHRRQAIMELKFITKEN